jgi:hypothetical protein
VDAVRCAAEIQRGMLDREPDMPEERRIRLRIGVNLGDVNDPDGYHLRPLNMPRHTGVSSSDLSVKAFDAALRSWPPDLSGMRSPRCCLGELYIVYEAPIDRASHSLMLPEGPHCG